MRGSLHDATEVERKTLETGFDSMRQGFKGALNLLANDLASA